MKTHAHYMDLDRETISQTQLAKKQGDRIFRASLVITGVGGLIILLLAASFWFFPVANVLAVLDQASSWLLVWRALLFLVLIGAWRYWAGLYRCWGYLDARQYTRLLNQRWRMACWLIVLELVFNQHVIDRFLNNLLQ